jgi:Opacity-associated protein A LysM-like domain
MLNQLKLMAATSVFAGVLIAVGPLVALGPSGEREPLAPDNYGDLDAVTQVAALARWEAEAMIAPPAAVTRTHKIRSGETLPNIFATNGLTTAEVNAAMNALRGVVNPRRGLDAGEELVFTYEMNEAGNSMRFARAAFPTGPDRSIIVERGYDGLYEAKEFPRAVERRMVRVQGQSRTACMKRRIAPVFRARRSAS